MSSDHITTISDKPVLIVGAGPTGLIVGIELARRGVPFHLIDRMASPAPWSAAIYIKSRSLEILAALGLIDDFIERGQIVDGVDVYLAEKHVGSYRFHDLDTPYPYILSIPEEQTVKLLTEKLEQLSGQVERGVEFLGLEESGDTVRARLKSENTGEYLLEAQWVVGTDGYHSAVRDAIGDQFDGKDYPELWGVVDSQIENWCHPSNLTCAQLQPPNVIPFPLGKDRWRVYFRPETTDDAALEMVNERLALVSPGAKLAHTDEPQFFKSHSRLARQYRMGRVFLAGDAAHGSNPIEGHAMNAGMQDAFNLGWKLALIVSGKGSEQLIASYEAERRPVDRSIVQSGDEAYMRMDPKSDKARRERIEFLATSEGQDYAAMAASEITFAYEQNPLVEEVGPPLPASPRRTAMGARVGEVAELVGSEGTLHLDELIYGTTPSLFFVMPGEGPLAALAEARALLKDAIGHLRLVRDSAFVVQRGPAPAAPVPEDLLYDPSGLLHERLCDTEACLCVIRPDGHLGFRSSPPSTEALSKYLARIFGPRSK